MVYISSKVINTILTLTDKMSAPLKNTSKAVQRSQQALDRLKSTQSAFRTAASKATRKVEDQRAKVEELIKVHGEESQEVAEAKDKLKVYTEALKSAREASQSAAKATKEHARAHKQLRDRVEASQNAMNKFTSGVDKAVKGVAKVTAGAAAAVGSAALGVGFKEAFDMEGYKMQLLTATKDTEKASRAMSAAVKFANSTPFETGEVVGAVAKMEAYGLSSEKWLKDIADMAGATNKSIDQATEAMADAVMGEWERLKEFGIKKEMLIEAAAKKYGKNVVFNKKGQVKDQLKLETILQEVMREKYEGGAAAMANTFKGKWSTITGVTKSALAKIVGMNEDGTIRTGSMYEKLKDKMQAVIDVLNKALEDGTVERIADNVTNAINKTISVIGKVISFIKEHEEIIKTITISVGSFVSVIYTYNKVMQAYTAITKIAGLTTAFFSGPIGWVALAIGAVVAVAYKMGVLDDIFRGITGAVQVFWGVIKSIPEGVKEAFTALYEWLPKPVQDIMNVFSGIITSIFPGISEVFTKTFKWVGEKMNAFAEKFKKLKRILGFSKEKNNSVRIEVEEKTKNVSSNKIATSSKAVNTAAEKKNSKAESSSLKPQVTPAKTGVLPAYSENKNAAVNSAKQKEKTVEKVVVEKAKEQPITITFNGDVYGFEDFKEKVAQAIIEMKRLNNANVVA